MDANPLRAGTAPGPASSRPAIPRHPLAAVLGARRGRWHAPPVQDERVPAEPKAPAGRSGETPASTRAKAPGRGPERQRRARASGGAARWLVIAVPAAAVAAAVVIGRAPDPTAGGASARPSSEAERPPAKRRDAPLAGTAKEVIQAASYTYVLVGTEDEGDQWAAVNRSEIAKGDAVVVDEAILMERFESKALRRTFDRIWFGVLLTRGIEEGEPPPAPRPEAPAAPSGAPAASGSAADPSGVLTPADVLARAKELSGKRVRVSGEVTKVNEGILDRNWIHLSGGAKDGARNDLLVTSKASAKPGDVLTVTGSVAVDKDFGAGYRYAVVVEDAELVPARR